MISVSWRSRDCRRDTNFRLACLLRRAHFSALHASHVHFTALCGSHVHSTAQCGRQAYFTVLCVHHYEHFTELCGSHVHFISNVHFTVLCIHQSCALYCTVCQPCALHCIVRTPAVCTSLHCAYISRVHFTALAHARQGPSPYPNATTTITTTTATRRACTPLQLVVIVFEAEVGEQAGRQVRVVAYGSPPVVAQRREAVVVVGVRQVGHRVEQ